MPSDTVPADRGALDFVLKAHPETVTSACRRWRPRSSSWRRSACSDGTRTRRAGSAGTGAAGSSGRDGAVRAAGGAGGDGGTAGAAGSGGTGDAGTGGTRRRRRQHRRRGGGGASVGGSVGGSAAARGGHRRSRHAAAVAEQRRRRRRRQHEPVPEQPLRPRLPAAGGRRRATCCGACRTIRRRSTACSGTATTWSAMTDDGWTNGKSLHYPDGTGSPDAEGLTRAEWSSTAIYVSSRARQQRQHASAA